MWKLNNTLQRNKKIKKEIKKYFETNENGNTTYQNLWDIEKVAVRGKSIAIHFYIK